MTPITSLDVRPGPVRPDPLLVSLPWRPESLPSPKRPSIATWLQEHRRQRAMRREWRRRIGHHLIAATAPAMRKREPRRSRLWVWAVCAYLTLPAVAVMVGASLWLLRRIAT